MEHEVPDGKLAKIIVKFGWVVPPTIFILLIIFTIFTVSNLRLDPFTGKIQKSVYVHIRGVSNARVYLNDKNIGDSSQVLSVPISLEELSETKQLRVETSDGRKWNTLLRPQEGLVSIYYPILYPDKIDFAEDSFEAQKVYKTQANGVFFYEKFENGKWYLYKFSAYNALLDLAIENTLFADLTELLQLGNNPQGQEILEDQLNNKKLIPSPKGRRAALVIPNNKILILEGNTRYTEVAGYIPKEGTKYFWSPNEDFLIMQDEREIFSRNISSGSTNLLFKTSIPEEKVEIQFCSDNTIFFTITSPDKIDLAQNSYLGTNLKYVDLPNFDNIRKGNFIKAYDFIKKQNVIIIQTNDNIFSFNLTNHEFKKFNLYKNEKIILIDPENEMVWTNNTESKSQFRYYNLNRYENGSFRIYNAPNNTNPSEIIHFNRGQNLFIEYTDNLILSDYDGGNQVNAAQEPNAHIITALKDGIHVLLVKSTPSPPQGAPNNLTVRIERFKN